MRDYATKDKLLYGPPKHSDRHSGKPGKPQKNKPTRYRLWLALWSLVGIACIALGLGWAVKHRKTETAHPQEVAHKPVVTPSNHPTPPTITPKQIPGKTETVKTTVTAANDVQTAPQKAIKKPVSKIEKPTEPKFEFYTLLPKQKVQTPPTELKTETRTPRSFMLQVASYQDAPPAQAMLAHLVKLKLPAKVDRVGSSRNTWYRVDLGPYP